MRDEEGKRTQAGRSRKWQDCLAEVWALGSRGAPEIHRVTLQPLSHGWTTSSLLGGFLLSTKPAALTSPGCFAQLEQGSKLVPAGLWAHSGGRQLGSIRLSIFLFSPYHQQSLLLLLKGDGIRILSVAWALQSVPTHCLLHISCGWSFWGNLGYADFPGKDAPGAMMRWTLVSMDK